MLCKNRKHPVFVALGYFLIVSVAMISKAFLLAEASDCFDYNRQACLKDEVCVWKLQVKTDTEVEEAQCIVAPTDEECEVLTRRRACRRRGCRWRRGGDGETHTCKKKTPSTSTTLEEDVDKKKALRQEKKRMKKFLGSLIGSTSEAAKKRVESEFSSEDGYFVIVCPDVQCAMRNYDEKRIKLFVKDDIVMEVILG